MHFYNVALNTRRDRRDPDDDTPITFDPHVNYSLSVPAQLVRKFSNESGDERGRTRMVSQLFSSVTGLFPGGGSGTPSARSAQSSTV